MPYQYEETRLIRAAADLAFSSMPDDQADSTSVPTANFEALKEAVEALQDTYGTRSWLDTNGPDLSWREFWELVGPGKKEG